MRRRKDWFEIEKTLECEYEYENDWGYRKMKCVSKFDDSVGKEKNDPMLLVIMCYD